VSVGFDQPSVVDYKPALPVGDGLPHDLQPASFSSDLNLEHFFDLDSFIDPTVVDSPLPPHQGFFDDSFLPPADHTADSTAAFDSFGFSEPFDANLFDLHADSGATFVSDEPGNAARV